MGGLLEGEGLFERGRLSQVKLFFVEKKTLKFSDLKICMCNQMVTSEIGE